MMVNSHLGPIYVLEARESGWAAMIKMFFFLLLTISYNKICRYNHHHLDTSKSSPKWDNKDNEVEEDINRHGLDMCHDACWACGMFFILVCNFFFSLYICTLLIIIQIDYYKWPPQTMQHKHMRTMTNCYEWWWGYENWDRDWNDCDIVI